MKRKSPFNQPTLQPSHYHSSSEDPGSSDEEQDSGDSDTHEYASANTAQLRPRGYQQPNFSESSESEQDASDAGTGDDLAAQATSSNALKTASPAIELTEEADQPQPMQTRNNNIKFMPDVHKAVNHVETTAVVEIPQPMRQDRSSNASAEPPVVITPLSISLMRQFILCDMPVTLWKNLFEKAMGQDEMTAEGLAAIRAHLPNTITSDPTLTVFWENLFERWFPLEALVFKNKNNPYTWQDLFYDRYQKLKLIFPQGIWDEHYPIAEMTQLRDALLRIDYILYEQVVGVLTSSALHFLDKLKREFRNNKSLRYYQGLLLQHLELSTGSAFKLESEIHQHSTPEQMTDTEVLFSPEIKIIPGLKLLFKHIDTNLTLHPRLVCQCSSTNFSGLPGIEILRWLTFLWIKPNPLGKNPESIIMDMSETDHPGLLRALLGKGLNTIKCLSFTSLTENRNWNTVLALLALANLRQGHPEKNQPFKPNWLAFFRTLNAAQWQLLLSMCAQHDFDENYLKLYLATNPTPNQKCYFNGRIVPAFKNLSQLALFDSWKNWAEVIVTKSLDPRLLTEIMRDQPLFSYARIQSKSQLIQDDLWFKIIAAAKTNIQWQQYLLASFDPKNAERWNQEFFIGLIIHTSKTQSIEQKNAVQFVITILKQNKLIIPLPEMLDIIAKNGFSMNTLKSFPHTLKMLLQAGATPQPHDMDAQWLWKDLDCDKLVQAMKRALPVACTQAAKSATDDMSYATMIADLKKLFHAYQQTALKLLPYKPQELPIPLDPALIASCNSSQSTNEIANASQKRRRTDNYQETVPSLNLQYLPPDLVRGVLLDYILLDVDPQKHGPINLLHLRLVSKAFVAFFDQFWPSLVQKWFPLETLLLELSMRNLQAWRGWRSYFLDRWKRLDDDNKPNKLNIHYYPRNELDEIAQQLNKINIDDPSKFLELGNCINEKFNAVWSHGVIARKCSQGKLHDSILDFAPHATMLDYHANEVDIGTRTLLGNNYSAFVTHRLRLRRQLGYYQGLIMQFIQAKLANNSLDRIYPAQNLQDNMLITPFDEIMLWIYYLRGATNIPLQLIDSYRRSIPLESDKQFHFHIDYPLLMPLFGSNVDENVSIGWFSILDCNHLVIKMSDYLNIKLTKNFVNSNSRFKPLTGLFFYEACTAEQWDTLMQLFNEYELSSSHLKLYFAKVKPNEKTKTKLKNLLIPTLENFSELLQIADARHWFQVIIKHDLSQALLDKCRTFRKPDELPFTLKQDGTQDILFDILEYPQRRKYPWKKYLEMAIYPISYERYDAEFYVKLITFSHLGTFDVDVDVETYLVDLLKKHAVITRLPRLLHILSRSEDMNHLISNRKYIKLLLYAGAEISHEDRYHIFWTNMAFNRATTVIYQHDLDDFKALLDFIADLNLRDENGDTLSHRIAHKANIDLLPTLFNKGADFSVTNLKGQTVLDLIPEPLREKFKSQPQEKRLNQAACESNKLKSHNYISAKQLLLKAYQTVATQLKAHQPDAQLPLPLVIGFVPQLLTPIRAATLIPQTQAQIGSTTIVPPPPLLPVPTLQLPETPVSAQLLTRFALVAQPSRQLQPSSTATEKVSSVPNISF